MFLNHAFLVPGRAPFVAVMLAPKISVVSLPWFYNTVVRTVLSSDLARDDMSLELPWKHLIAAMYSCEYLKRP
jgi:hypothetical protein